MTPVEALALFRSEMSDEEAPYLWSDVDAYGYLDDAQKMFCRLTDGISDATTSAVVNVAVPIDSDWVNLHPSILKIRGCTVASNGTPLNVLNYEDMVAHNHRFDGAKGPIARLVVGMQEGKARVHPVASIADTLRLLVFRLPLITVDADGAFEIAEQHHRHLLPWAQHLAYLKQDAECFDRTKAEEHEKRFRAYCFAAQQEQRKSRHKVRTVAYGGI